MDNRVLKQVPASSARVFPYYIKNMEKKGLIYTTNQYSEAKGAQCGHCHTIVWVLGRKDPILNEKKPDHIPDNDPIPYRVYVEEKLERFLRSLPPCPECHTQSYDLFVNNVTTTRFKDGTSALDFVPSYSCNHELSESAKDTLIWVYD